MKNLSLFIKCVFLLLSITYSFSARALDAAITYGTFKGTTANYVEIYVFVAGNSLEQKQVDSINMVETVEMLIVFKQADSIVRASKYRLISPPSVNPVNLQDLRRFELPDGTYSLEVTLKDANSDKPEQTFRTQIVVLFGNREKLQQSDIVLLTQATPDTNTNNPFVKNGYFLLPAPANYLDRHASNLFFYYELYNTDAAFNGDFLISYSIEKKYVEGEKPFAIGHKRHKRDETVILLAGLDITKLESGFYKLVVTVRNPQSEIVLSKEIDFQRSNPFIVVSVDTVKVAQIADENLDNQFVGQLTNDELNYALRAISMHFRGDQSRDLVTTIKQDSIIAKRRMLFNYFVQRSPNMPEYAYDQYMLLARKIDEYYKNGFGSGFQTDRGIMYLRYGQPNDIISVEDEMSAPPYEIWVYNKIEATGQSNVKFLFYNPHLVANGHQLLHSTCRGERQNTNWKGELYRNVPNQVQGNGINGFQVDKNTNRRAEQLFNDL